MFHYTNAITRKVSSLGLKSEYNKGVASNFYLWLGEVVALKMVPLKYALSTWNRRLRHGPALLPGQTHSTAVLNMIDYVQVCTLTFSKKKIHSSDNTIIHNN